MPLLKEQKILLEECVQRGVAFLSRKEPRWRMKIRQNIEKTGKKISISSDRRCVLGKLYGDYYGGVTVLNLHLVRLFSLGFIGNLDMPWNASCEYLSKLWTREVFRYVRTKK